MRTRFFVIGFSTVLLVGLGARSGLAQTTGSIFGTVTDASQAVIPGVTVTIRNVDTAFVRPVVTDPEGRYRAPSLPLGNYEIQAELMGFQTAIRRGVVLTVGREAQVDFRLNVGDLAETVVVTGEVPLIETQSAAMSGLVDSEKMRELPLNARDYVQLATLQPGVTIVDTGSRMDAGTSSGSVGRGVGVKLSISGARTNANAYQLDGTDVNDYANTTPGSITGSNLGVEAIREFRVLTNTYSAEYGRSAGGIITAVSRSGTNALHGSVFEFHRNDALDSPNYFDVKFDREKPDFVRNQFGAAVGGPIVRDKLFFFSNYEGHRETIGVTSVSSVLTAQARQGTLTTGRVTVDPAIRPILDLFPLPNGAIAGNLGDFIVESTADVGEDFVVGRIDHQLSDRHNYFVRYTFSDAGVVRPDDLLLNNNEGGSKRQFTTFDWKTVVSPTLLSSFTFAFNRTETFNGLQTELTKVPDISFVPGRPMGSISVGGGMSGFPGGVGTADLDLFDYKVLQVRNDVNWTRGRHNVKFGVNLERLITDMDGSNTPNGTFSFGSITDFLENRPDGFRGMGPGSDVVRNFRQNLIGLYIQDDFRLAGNLTLNAGLRYEFITDVKEANGKIGNLRNFSDATFTQGKFFENPSYKNFAPRIGVVWDPTGQGTTAIRGGFGIYYDQILTHYFSGGFAIQNPPYFRGAALGAEFMKQGDFPGAWEKFVALGTSAAGSWVEWFDYRPDQPYAMQFNANIQQQLGNDLMIMAGYVGYRGENFKRISEDGNIRVPVELPDGRFFFNHAGANPCPIAACFNSPRRNPNFGGIKTAALDGRATYHALQVGLNKRSSGGLDFQASYTLGKAMDHASGVFNEKDLSNSNLQPNFWDREDTWGPADHDVRHNLMLNYSYQLPIPDMSGLAGVLLNGWQWGGILRAASGQPYTPILGNDQARSLSFRGAGGQRPSVPEGHSGQIESTGDPDGWFDRTQFVMPAPGYLGNLGRGVGRGDGVITLDTTLTKNTYLDDTRHLQFRFELFNALNQDNFRNPGRPAVFNSRGAVNQNAGRITSTSTRNRQIQLSVKFYF